jgi:hypothetical protein
MSRVYDFGLGGQIPDSSTKFGSSTIAPGAIVLFAWDCAIWM